jgi:Carbohydrate-selective porin, OprB family
VNWQQQVNDNIGVFARAGWADGNVEPWDFTDIDDTISAGTRLSGKLWARPDDTVGIAGVVNSISAVHQAFQPPVPQVQHAWNAFPVAVSEPGVGGGVGWDAFWKIDLRKRAVGPFRGLASGLKLHRDRDNEANAVRPELLCVDCHRTTSSLGHNTELLHQRQIILNVPIVSNEPVCNLEKIGGDETDELAAPSVWPNLPVK